MRRSHITILVAAAVFGATGVLFTTQVSTGRQAKGISKDQAPTGLIPTSRSPLPAHRLASIDQQEPQLGELSRGRVLLVYITTSCEPCIKEVKSISRLQALKPTDLRIYGVSFERAEQVATFVKAQDLKFPVLIDTNALLARSLDVRYFPSKFLVEDGAITKMWRGITTDEPELYRQLNLQ